MEGRKPAYSKQHESWLIGTENETAETSKQIQLASKILRAAVQSKGVNAKKVMLMSETITFFRDKWIGH